MTSLTEEVKFLFTDREFALGELTIDAVLRETHELRAQISEHPVETGESFYDHVSNLSTSIQLEGIITNTPMTFIGLTAARSFKNFIDGQSNDIADAAFKKLEDIFIERTPITITTSLKEYKNMVLESISVEREASSVCKW